MVEPQQSAPAPSLVRPHDRSRTRLAALGIGLLVAATAGCSPPETNIPTTAASSPPVASPSPTPTPEPTAKPPAPQVKSNQITESTIFGSGAVDLLNAYDLGDRTTQLGICQGMGSVLNGMTDAQMSTKMNAMDDYDYSTLTDLVDECNQLLN